MPGYEITQREVFMHNVVGFGLIFLLLGYIGWLAMGGTAFRGGSQGETVTNGQENGPDSTPSVSREFRIVTLLPFDAIRSIDSPRFDSSDVADENYSPTELILGVEIDGDARAYSVPLLSQREIVNDVVGGKPIAITW